MSKKYIVALAGLVVAVCFAAATFAGQATMEEKTTLKKGEVTQQEGATIKTKGGTETFKETTTTTPTGKETSATITATPKKGDLVKEKVTFHSYTNDNGGTITVIKENKEVKMPARHYSNWKNNLIGKEKQEVTIYSTYDPNLLQYVVTDVKP